MAQTSKNLPAGKPKDWFSKVAIVRTSVRRQDFPTQQAYIAEKECINRSQQVAELISQLGIAAVVIKADQYLAQKLRQEKPDLCLNFVDTVHGSGAAASGIPGLFELLQIPYVGAGTLALALNSNKYLTRQLLAAWEIPTPQCQLFRTPSQDMDYDLRFPLIVKLNEEHGSVGLDSTSVVTHNRELKDKIKYLIDTYRQPVLVEEYIEDARELTGVVLESTQTKVMLSERKYKATEGTFKILTFATKWATDLGYSEPVEYCPADKLDKNIITKIKDDLRTAFEVLRMDDLGRFDVMLDKYNHHYIVDCNANPSLGPESSVARTASVNHQKFETIIVNILHRNKLDGLNQAQVTTKSSPNQV